MSKRKNIGLITCLFLQLLSVWCIDVSITTLNLGIMTNGFFNLNPIQSYHIGLYTLLISSVICCFISIGD